MKTRESLAVLLCTGLMQVACSGDDATDGPRMVVDDSTGDGADPVDGNDDEGDGEGDGDGAADGDEDPVDGTDGDGEGDGEGDGTPVDEPCDGACTDGEVCNEDTDTCEPVAPEGCTDDRECGAGETCNTTTGECEAEPGCPGTAAPGLTVTRVAINQAVDIPVVQGGQLVPDTRREAPIVQNRSALFRVSVAPTADFVPADITTEITLTNDGVDTRVTGHGMIAEASDESTLEGTANVLVPGDLIGPNTSFRIAFTQNRCVDVTGESVFPDEGDIEIGAEKTGHLKVVIVPYERAPFKLITTPEVMERVRQGLYAYYPVEAVDLSVRAEAIPVMNPQTDLQRVLQHVRGVRAEDNPSDDTFYFGMFTAADTMREFCGDGCIAGIATLGGSGASGQAAERYGVGIGYLTDTETTSMGMPTTDFEISVNVMAHELGHAHGRRHSPCGDAAGPDPNYPNDTGDIEAYGYSLASGKFATPTHKDLMSYCEPQWISPYTYNALATRVTGINEAVGGRVRLGPPTEYASVVVHKDGRAAWGDNVTLRLPPSGTQATARALDATGAVVDANVAVTLSELADLDGALVTLPVPGHDWASLELDGQLIAIQ